MERTRRNMTIVLSALTALLGVAMVVSAVTRGGAPTSIGVVVGVAFMILGCARAYLSLGAPRRRP